jgi:hypothetical protein
MQSLAPLDQLEIPIVRRTGNQEQSPMAVEVEEQTQPGRDKPYASATVHARGPFNPHAIPLVYVDNRKTLRFPGGETALAVLHGPDASTMELVAASQGLKVVMKQGLG